MGIIRAAHSPFNFPVWPIKKPDGTWRMTVDYRELNKVIPPVHAAVPSVMDLADWLTNELGTYHLVADLANAFFSIDLALESQDQFAFLREGQQWTFTVLPQGYLHSLSICHGLVAEDLAKQPQSPKVCLFHYTDDILLTSNSLAELEKAVPQVLSHLKSCGWTVNETKLQGPGLLVRFLGVVWSGKTKSFMMW